MMRMGGANLLWNSEFGITHGFNQNDGTEDFGTQPS